MYTIHRALSDLTVVDGKVLDQDGNPFDRVAYSRFKYGYVPPAIRYGKELATLITDKLFARAQKEPIVIVSAPYKFLPTASDGIARSLLQVLSHQALVDGRDLPVLVPFTKTRVAEGSYASSSALERISMLSSLGLSIDEEFIRGSHVLVVDDIRITGTAERAVSNYLDTLDAAGIWYLHAARLHKDIGNVYPHLENELNHSVAHRVASFIRDDERNVFRLNTRVLRFILESDIDEFDSFIRSASRELLLQIHESAVGSGSEYYGRYALRLEAIYRFILMRSRPSVLAN